VPVVYQAIERHGGRAASIFLLFLFRFKLSLSLSFSFSFRLQETHVKCDISLICFMLAQKQQRVAVGPGNAHFISIRQVSFDRHTTLQRGT